MSDNDIAMKHEPQVDLSVIARQQQQTLSEIRTLRDDFTFMAAIAQRMDGAIQGLVNEIRADDAAAPRLYLPGILPTNLVLDRPTSKREEL